VFIVLYVVPLGMSLFVVPHFIAIFTQLEAIR
jgi:type II secretory pathway component PulF